MNQDAGYYAVNVIFGKQQGVRDVWIWTNLSGQITALLNPVVNPKRKSIAENVMILSVLCYIRLPMIWNKAIMA